MLTPEQKQRILTATGWTVGRVTAPGYLSGVYLWYKYHNGKGNGVGYKTELAAWDSWEPDANWCEETLKVFVRGLSPNQQEQFLQIWDEVCGANELDAFDVWLALTPELLCTAFDTFLLERESK